MNDRGPMLLMAVTDREGRSAARSLQMPTYCDASIQCIQIRKWTALGAAIQLAEFDPKNPSDRMLAEYLRVVTGLSRYLRLVPLRFGQIAENRPQLDDALLDGDWSRLLERLGGRLELRFSTSVPYSDDECPPRDRERTDSGRAYLESRRAHHASNHNLLPPSVRRRCDDIVDRLPVSVVDRRYRVATLPEEGPADIDIELLVDANLAQTVVDHLETLGWNRARIRGPWAPFSFADDPRSPSLDSETPSDSASPTATS